MQADITADAATLFVRNPDWQFVFETDKPTAVATRKRLYDMASSDKMMVQGYHLAFPAVGYVEEERQRLQDRARHLDAVDLIATPSRRPPFGRPFRIWLA